MKKKISQQRVQHTYPGGRDGEVYITRPGVFELAREGV